MPLKASRVKGKRPSNVGVFNDDFSWQMRFAPTIQTLVGPHLLRPAELEVDQRRATDFLVFRAEGVTVAARVRRAKYARNPIYRKQVTVRSRRDTGASTEWEKVFEGGWADWMFYGFELTEDSLSISPWVILDLAVLRRLWRCFGTRIIADEKANGDGTHFRALVPGDLCQRLPISARGLIIAWEEGLRADRQTKMFDRARWIARR